MNWLDDILTQRWQQAEAWVRSRFDEGGGAPSHWMQLLRDAGWSECVPLPAEGAIRRHSDRLSQDLPPDLLCLLEALAACSPAAAAILCAHTAARMALFAGAAENCLRDLGCEPAGQWLSWPLYHDIEEQLWPVMNEHGHLQGQVEMLLPGALANWAILPAQGRDRALHLVMVDLRHPAVIRGQPIRTLGLPDSGLNDIEFGGVPCEMVAMNGGAVFYEVSRKMSSAGIALFCGLSRASIEAASRHVRLLRASAPVGQAENAMRSQALDWLSHMRERLGVMQALLAYAGARKLKAHEATWGRSVTSQPSTDLNHSFAHLLRSGECASALCSDALHVLSIQGGIESDEAGRMRREAERVQAQRVCDARQLMGLSGGVTWRRYGGRWSREGM